MAELFTLFPVIGSIALICLVICQLLKLIPNMKTDAIPVISAILGGVVAGACSVFGIPPVAGTAVMDAIASGITSGFAASGLYDFGKFVIGKVKGSTAVVK